MFLGFGNPGALPQVRHGESVLWRIGMNDAPLALNTYLTLLGRRAAGLSGEAEKLHNRFGDCGQSPLPTKSTQAFDTNASTTARVAVLVSSTASGMSLGYLFQLRAEHIHSPVAVEVAR